MPFEGEPIQLSLQQRSELEEIARSQSLPADFVLRAKILSSPTALTCPPESAHPGSDNRTKVRRTG
jgi:hypothetical protein